MSTTAKPAPAKKVKTDGRKPAAKTATQAPVKPRRRKGPELPIDPIELPRVPAHEYGQHRHVSNIEIGDVIFVGGRQNLSTFEVADVRATADGRQIAIVALAIDFVHGGVLFSGNEQVTFLAETNARIGVKNA